MSGSDYLIEYFIIAYCHNRVIFDSNYSPLATIDLKDLQKLRKTLLKKTVGLCTLRTIQGCSVKAEVRLDPLERCVWNYQYDKYNYFLLTPSFFLKPGL